MFKVGHLTLGEYTDWRHLTTRLVSQLGNKSQMSGVCMKLMKGGGVGGRGKGRGGRSGWGKRGRENWLSLLVLVTYVWVNSSCEHPPPPPPPANPWAFEKIVQMISPAGNFCWQMLHPPFLLWWSNARLSSPSDQYTKLLVAIFK